MIGADLNAGFTTNTLGWVIHFLNFWRNALRIVAPGATKGTSFKEYRKSYAGAVVDGIFFYVEDKT